MSMKELCPSIKGKELASINNKVNGLLNFVFGDNKQTKNLYSTTKKGVKKISGQRAVKPVKINDVIYGSIGIASKMLGESVGSISSKCNDNRFRLYSFIKPPTQINK